MSSCQEAAHGLGRPLADRDRGARAKQEERRGETPEGMLSRPHRGALSSGCAEVSHLLLDPDPSLFSSLPRSVGGL